jgi:hypothetical protein
MSAAQRLTLAEAKTKLNKECGLHVARGGSRNQNQKGLRVTCEQGHVTEA